MIYFLRDIKIIAWTTLIFGIILYFADKCRFNKKISSNLNLKTILYIGLFQTLALIPGVSRAGITMTASRFLRFNRFDSSKISFFIGYTCVSRSKCVKLEGCCWSRVLKLNYLILIAITFSFLSSYFTVKFFLQVYK